MTDYDDNFTSHKPDRPTLARGEYERDGTVSIHWNCQETKLASPSGGCYFPCDACGVVYDVPHDVVSFVCESCSHHKRTCDDIDCTHHVHKRLSGMSAYERQEVSGDAH